MNTKNHQEQVVMPDPLKEDETLLPATATPEQRDNQKQLEENNNPVDQKDSELGLIVPVVQPIIKTKWGVGHIHTPAQSDNDDNDDESPSLKSQGDENTIDKLAVEGAKAVVSQNKHDPYHMSLELSRFKAEYIKQRFGKTVKVRK